MTLLHAIIGWFQGPPPGDQMMWLGQKVYWWRRLARVIQYGAATVVLLDIIGDGTLRLAEMRLHARHDRMRRRYGDLLRAHDHWIALNAELVMLRPVDKFIVDRIEVEHGRREKSHLVERRINPSWNQSREDEKARRRKAIQEELEFLPKDVTRDVVGASSAVLGMSLAIGTMVWIYYHVSPPKPTPSFIYVLPIPIALSAAAIGMKVGEVIGVQLVRPLVLASKSAAILATAAVVAILRRRRSILIASFLLLTAGSALDLVLT